MKTPPTGCLTDKTPVVNQTLVYNHNNLFTPPFIISQFTQEGDAFINAGCVGAIHHPYSVAITSALGVTFPLSWPQCMIEFFWHVGLLPSMIFAV